MPKNKGWIKIHRRLLDWEWYSDTNMVRLFLHLLLKANTDDRRWQGREVPRGSLVTSRATLEAETGISQKTIRTCLARLIATGEIEVEATNRFSLVTICNLDNYQESEQGERPTGGQPNGQQTASQTAKLKGYANANETSNCEAEKETSGQVNAQQTANQTATLKEYIYNNISVVDARAREEISTEDFLRQYFAPNREAALQAICKNLGMRTIAELRELAEQIAAEWQAAEQTHRDFRDAATHLLSQARKKLAAAAQSSRPSGQTSRRRAYSADSREVNDRWKNSKYTPPKE